MSAKLKISEFVWRGISLYRFYTTLMTWTMNNDKKYHLSSRCWLLYTCTCTPIKLRLQLQELETLSALFFHSTMSTRTSSIDPRNGFCSETKIYHSLRPPVAHPPLSFADFIFSLLHSFPLPPTSSALIDGLTGRSISFADLVPRAKTLASSLRRKVGLRKGDTAFILSSNSVDVPVLYLSLLSIGVVVSPANPASSKQEILHLLSLSRPRIAFATSGTAHKIPSYIRKILIDTVEFESLTASTEARSGDLEPSVTICQSDAAAILYSSGTTGKTKGVLLTHRNFTSVVAAVHASRPARKSPPAVCLATVPYFHIYGFALCLRTIAFGETLVSMERINVQKMLKAIQEYRVSHVAAAPPLVISLIKLDRNVMDSYDLSSLEVVACGGAPLGRDAAALFNCLFPRALLVQAYGLTESTGRVFTTVGPTESKVGGATGKLCPSCEAKIVHPETGIPLPPGKAGELWIRGPAIMKGYVGDEEATARTLDLEGWLRTGDLCYIDEEGFLFVVDRIKELIKCRGYQVAPAELEHLLQSHPEILEAAVVPFPDEKAGQVPVAFVARKNGSTIGESQIKKFIADQVAPYKRIHRVMFIDSLPKNAQGKVLRKDLTKLVMSTAKL
ncbi:4-coumarate--CoA ligase-like 9 [Linum perenne]